VRQAEALVLAHGEALQEIRSGKPAGSAQGSEKLYGRENTDPSSSPAHRVLLITLFDRILLTIGGRQRQSIAPA